MREFIKFTNQAAFDAWHQRQRTRLGFPRVGFRQSDGIPQPNKQQTVDYTTPIVKSKLANAEVIAFIDKNGDRESKRKYTEEELKADGWTVLEERD